MKAEIKRLQKNKLFLKNTLAVTAVFLLITIILMLLVGYNDIKNSKEKSLENVDKGIKNMYNSSENFFNSYYLQLTKILVGSNAEIFSSKNYNEELFLQSGKDIVSSLSQGVTFFNSVDSIYLYSKFKNYLLTSEGTFSTSAFEDMGWLKNTNIDSNEFKIFNRIVPEKGEMLTFTFTMNGSSTKNITGVMNINISKHFEAYKNDGYQVVFFQKPTNKILYRSGYELKNDEILKLFTETKNNKSNIMKVGKNHYAVSVKDSAYGDFSYGMIEKLDNYGSMLFLRLLTIILTLIGVIFLILFMFFFYADTSYRPILGIAEILENPSSKVSQKYLENDDTTKKIAENILFLVSSNENLENELNKKTKIFEYTQLKALQWQMNPHFIFNTLNMLHLMSLDKNADKELFSSSIISLSRLMRYYLKTETMTVTLQEEKAMTEEYIKILRARNGDNFEITWDIDSSLFEKKVTKMCLQPILENCFKYGIYTDGEKMKVQISAKKEDDYLIITIDDNCSEITQEKTDELNEFFKKDVDIPENHIGLKNINARISLMYGSTYGVTVGNRLPKKGLSVFIKFPLHI